MKHKKPIIIELEGQRVIKVLNFILPFLIEMIFGKKGDDATHHPLQKLKRIIAYIFISVSISINYITISRLYSLSMKYIAMEHENSVLEGKEAQCKEAGIRVKQIQETLNYCIKTNALKKK